MGIGLTFEEEKNRSRWQMAIAVVITIVLAVIGTTYPMMYLEGELSAGQSIGIVFGLCMLCFSLMFYGVRE